MDIFWRIIILSISEIPLLMLGIFAYSGFVISGRTIHTKEPVDEVWEIIYKIFPKLWLIAIVFNIIWVFFIIPTK